MRSTMDFFEAQESARRSTVWLVLLFGIAVAAIVFLLYGVLAFALTFDDPVRPWWDPDLLLLVAAGALGVILIGTLYKMVKLTRGGGAAIAAALGGVLVERASPDLLEKRLLNVVDEMAIASGVTVPQVYVLPHERSINALAAGARPNQAVVVVTRGMLETLSRDELQGVIAHEFSHILNGDMRINLRLVWLLNGLLLIALAGRGLMEGGKGAGEFVIGLVLFVIGYVGVFAGEIIKAAISRQREFLADAAAVQFTRNPRGIVSALEKAGTVSTLNTAHAEEASHMFFALADRLTLFHSHPPIAERIRRVDPGYVTEEDREQAKLAALSREPMAIGEVAARMAGERPEAIRESVGQFDASHLAFAEQVTAALPAALTTALGESRAAYSLVLALIVAPSADPAATLRANVAPDEVGPVLDLVAKVRGTAEALRLPLLQLALPGLRSLPADARQRLSDTAQELCDADGEITPFEAALAALLQRALATGAARSQAGARNLGAMRKELRLLLSLLAHAGAPESDKIERAFRAGVAHLPLSDPWHLLPREQCRPAKLGEVLAKLERLDYRSKAILIEACTATVAADEFMTLGEAELLRAIAAVLECPIPPLVDAGISKAPGRDEGRGCVQEEGDAVWYSQQQRQERGVGHESN